MKPTVLKPRRTLGMWLLGILFAFAALMGCLRVYATISMMRSLQALSESINIPYLIISGILTALGGLVGVGSIFLREIWVPKTALITAAVLSLLYWFDQFCFVENTTYINQAWGFSLMVNVFLLGLIAWVLTRKRVQAYYKGKLPE
jgi:hypothetical protein